MYIKKEKGPVFVTLPDGRRISRADLPPGNTVRWVASRKARVVEAVEAGLIAAAEACNTYGLSEEELASWRKLARAHGTESLKATLLQTYRITDV